MQGAFHGRTMGAMAVTSSKTFYRTGFAPLMPQVFIAPYPYCLHCKVRQIAPDGKDWYKVSITRMHMHAVVHSHVCTTLCSDMSCTQGSNVLHVSSMCLHVSCSLLL